MTVRPWVYCDRCYAQVTLDKAWARRRAGGRVWLCDTCIAEAPQWPILSDGTDVDAGDAQEREGTSDPT